MNTDHPELALDADGVPILTDLVPDEKSGNAVTDVTTAPPTLLTPADISRELLASEAVQQQLDQIANNLTRDVRLRIEQTLAEAIDAAINKTLDENSVQTCKNIRQLLETAMAEFITKALRDTDQVF